MWAQIIQAVLQTALKAAPGIATATSKAGRFEKQEMRKAIDRVKAGKTGMSQAAQNQIAASAQADQNAANRAASAELARSMAATGGNAPANLNVMKAQQTASAQAAAAGRALAAQQSAQLAAQQREEALGMAAKRKGEIKENWNAVAGSANPQVPSATGSSQSVASGYKSLGKK